MSAMPRISDAGQRRNLYERHNISVRGSQSRIAGIRVCHAMESGSRRQMQPMAQKLAKNCWSSSKMSEATANRTASPLAVQESTRRVAEERTSHVAYHAEMIRSDHSICSSIITPEGSAISSPGLSGGCRARFPRCCPPRRAARCAAALNSAELSLPSRLRSAR
jgi:hypothetical protein